MMVNPLEYAVRRVMEASQKVVVTIPLDALWRENGAPFSERVGTLSSKGVADLLRVVADVGRPLEWIPLSQSFEFWKAKVKPNICHTNEKTSLDAYPDSYCFSASLWKDPTDPAYEKIVLLEKRH
jgi:hypothetical protein